ncbi:MAG: RNA polymerase sigma factor [Candidatus Hydrogenedentes bacterium]|nr:RNA polymerase sigma factor [Candidatus Hydrogenedentota bacterium]
MIPTAPRVASVEPCPVREEISSVSDHTLEDLIAREYPRLRRLAWRFGLPEDELDDAVQDVLAKAWAARGRFRGDAAQSTWLTRVALNHFTSIRRGWLRNLKTFVRDPFATMSEPAPNTEHAVRDEAHERAVACIQRLPRKLRLVFVLRYLEEMSCADVAETLRIPEVTVRTRVYHARKKLREWMKGYEP